jgi:hypothetical protein
MTRFALSTLMLAGCAQGGQARWVMDTWLIDPAGQNLSAVTTWEVFGPNWESNQRPGNHVCTVVVEWTGTPTSDAVPADSCAACDRAWALDVAAFDSDCSDTVASHPLYMGLTGVGIGPVDASLAGEEGPADPAFGSFVEGEDGWVPHGWATPAAGDVTAWNGTAAFTLWPAFAWELAEPK